jgi:hypothetical protein
MNKYVHYLIWEIQEKALKQKILIRLRNLLVVVKNTSIKNLEIKLSEFKNDLQSQITILKDSFARMESRQEKQEEIVEKLKEHGTRIAILEEKQKNCESKCNNN